MSAEIIAKIRAQLAANEAAKAAPPNVHATFTQQSKNNVPASEVRNEPWPVITPGPSQVTLTRVDVIEMIRLNTEQLHIRICELENQNAAKSLEIRALKNAVGTLEIQNRQNVDKIVALERNFDIYTKATARDRADTTLTAPFAASLERNVDMQARATARDRADDTLAIANAPVTRDEFATLERKLNDQGMILDEHSEQLGKIVHGQTWTVNVLKGISSSIHTSIKENERNVAKSEVAISDRPTRDEGKHRDSTKSSADTMVPCPTCTGLKWPNQKVCKICKVSSQ